MKGKEEKTYGMSGEENEGRMDEYTSPDRCCELEREREREQSV